MGRPDSSLPPVIFTDTELLNRKRWRHSQVLNVPFGKHLSVISCPLYSHGRDGTVKRRTLQSKLLYSFVMNLVATHYISCTTLQLHITYGLHLPSFTALTHSHPPLHQSHSCHQSLINPDCFTTPASHSHTHI